MACSGAQSDGVDAPEHLPDVLRRVQSAFRSAHLRLRFHNQKNTTTVIQVYVHQLPSVLHDPGLVVTGLMPRITSTTSSVGYSPHSALQICQSICTNPISAKIVTQVYMHQFLFTLRDPGLRSTGVMPRNTFPMSDTGSSWYSVPHTCGVGFTIE